MVLMPFMEKSYQHLSLNIQDRLILFILSFYFNYIFLSLFCNILKYSVLFPDNPENESTCGFPQILVVLKEKENFQDLAEWLKR
jgi:hypothetical protein